MENSITSKCIELLSLNKRIHEIKPSKTTDESHTVTFYFEQDTTYVLKVNCKRKQFLALWKNFRSWLDDFRKIKYK